MDFQVLISNRDDATQSFVAIKNGARLRSMNKENFNRINPGQLDRIPEYVVSGANYARLFQLRNPGINSIDDITGIIGNGIIHKIILRTQYTPDAILYIGNEGLLVPRVIPVSFRKQQELANRPRFLTLDEFTQALNRVPTLRELSEDAADPEELAELKGKFTLPGGKKTRNKRKKRKSMKR
jgi:hypothetical protein